MGFYATTEVRDENRCSPVFRTHKSENRLIKTESLPSVPDEFKVCVENDYDYMGRRFRKTVKDDYSGGDYTTTNVTTYVWDGMNIIAEMCDAGYTNFNTWGLDLSGSMQGAGGVGGLLAVTRVTSSETNTYFPCFDGNGNVCQYVNESGVVVAAREYSPFGVSISLTGDMKDDFTHWWSTKPWDAKTSISEYEHRPYIPSLGRFGSRDPAGESLSSPQCYLFVRNRPTDSYDFLGLWGTGVHEGKTLEWAVMDLDFKYTGGSMIAAATEQVDSDFFPGTPTENNQKWHFDRPPGGLDSRLELSDEHLVKAFWECTWALGKDDPDEASKMMGRSLHPLQDWVAHGDFGSRMPTAVWVAHNKYSQQDPPLQNAGDFWEYVDNPGLDAVGGVNGRPAGNAMNWYFRLFTQQYGIPTGWHEIGWAEFQPGNQRITLTKSLTIGKLSAFYNHVKQHAKPCGECQKTFLWDIP